MWEEITDQKEKLPVDPSTGLAQLEFHLGRKESRTKDTM